MLRLDNLTPSVKKRRKKRVGRGIGSGKGTYSGRGIKGQKARSGAKYPRLTWLNKLPKLRGERQRKILRKEWQVVNLKDLRERFQEGDLVNKKTLFEKGLIQDLKRPVKILGQGTLDKRLKIAKEFSFSKKAAQRLEGMIHD